MISLENVWFRYPNGTVALKNVSLEFRVGVSYVVGPNGSGKTTLLKVASCIYCPTRGRIMIDGVEFWKADRKKMLELRRRIVYVHEKPILFRAPILDNLVLPLEIRGVPRSEAIKKAKEILKELDMMYIIKKRRRELSAGEAQMISLLRALLVEPEYLLLDEPTNMLDMANRRKIIDVLHRIRDRTTIVIASHDLLLPLQLPGSIVSMLNGEVKERMSSEEFMGLVKKFIVHEHS